MKIIPASFTVLDDLDILALAVRIEYCGRICYKSEERITRDSAIPFVRKMAEHGHNSVLEMGVITMRVQCDEQALIDHFFYNQPRYLHVDIEDNTLTVTGSVRAFREMAIFHPDCAISRAAVDFLAQAHPYFFENLPVRPGEKHARLKITKVALEEVDRLPREKLMKHRHIAVKFIVNRAVTHEIVRHRPCSFLQESQRYCRYSDNKFGGEVTFIKPLFFSQESEQYQLWEKAMADTEKIYLKLLETSTPQAARTVLPNSCKTELIVYANLAQWRHILALRTSAAAEPSMREVMIPLQEDLQRRFASVFSAR